MFIDLIAEFITPLIMFGYFVMIYMTTTAICKYIEVNMTNALIVIGYWIVVLVFRHLWDTYVWIILKALLVIVGVMNG